MLGRDPMLRGVGTLLLAGGLVLPMGCRRTDGTDRGQGPAQRMAEPPVRGGGLDLTPGPVPGSRFESDPLWQLAQKGAEVDLLRLAQREGAVGLLEGVQVGRSPALTALGALPHATDGALALRHLCELARAMEGDPAEPLLVAIHGIVAEPPRPREPFDVAGYAECLPVMQKLTRLPGLDSLRHDLASSATELLVEHRDAAKR